MHNRSRTKAYDMYHVYAFWSLVSLLVLTVFTYAYLVNATIFHTAQRQHIEDEIIEAKSAVSELELAIIDAGRGMTRAYAETLGFIDAPELVFVERNRSASFSLHEVGR